MKPKKIWQDVLRFLGNYFLLNLVNVLCKTIRVTFVNKSVVEALESDGKNYVIAFWHGTMLLPWYIGRGKNIVAVVSQSKDGELLARVLKRWGYDVVRGSSTRGGDVVLKMMIDYAKDKRTIAITPDGPTGPIHKMKAGAVITAQKSGVPLILAGIGIQKKKTLKSWDKFEIPAFFSKVKVVYSNPVYFDSEMSYNQTSDMIAYCESKLNEIQKEAGRFE